MTLRTSSRLAWTLGVWTLAALAAAADVKPPADAPATPAADNPLRSPRAMMTFFRAAATEERTEDAQRCLNFSQVDEEVRRTQAAEYVVHLVDVLAALADAGHFDPNDPNALSDEPTAETQTIGKDPVLLVIERYEQQLPPAPATNPNRPAEQAETPESADAEAPPPPKRQVWQFSATTVKDLPQMHEQLDKLVRMIDEPDLAVARNAEDEQTQQRLRSPHRLVSFFLDKYHNAQRDSAAYAEAMKSMDFSLALTQWREAGAVGSNDALLETRGPQYVDDLGQVLVTLLDRKVFALEDLPQAPDPNKTAEKIGDEQLEILVSRQANGKWRFPAATVARLPELVEMLEQADEEGAAAPAPTAKLIPEDTSSPRATLNMFLTAMNTNDIETAVRCLDLTRFDEAERAVADVWAGKLWLVMNRHKLFNLYAVPDAEDGQPFTVVKHTSGRADIAEVRHGPRTGEWLFTHNTVRKIDDLYRAFEGEPFVEGLEDARIPLWALPSLYVREYVVPPSLKQPLWSLQIWQWLGLTLLLTAGLIFRLAASILLPRIGNWMMSSLQAAILPHVWRRALLPSANLVMVLAWWFGLQFLDLGAQTMTWAWWILRVVVTVVAVVAAYRIIDVVMSYFQVRASQTASRLDDVLVPLLQKTLKVLVAAVGLVVVAGAFGYEVTPLLAGLGIGGLAFGLAAQDTLKNFFGSVNVVLDRPFQVGDWVRIGEVEGTVETVGLRSSRIRTFYNSEFIVPNSEIMTARIDNMGRRRWRRIKTTISVTYDTKPQTLEAFTEGIRELIRAHPYTRKDYYHCYFYNFGPASLDLLLYCFLEVPDWGTELRERQRLFLDIMRLAEKLGVEFAFPTQTLYMRQDQVDDQRSAHVPPSIDAAYDLGRREARGIKEEFLPGDAKPPPVEY